jgi:hypothetical protein
LVPTLVDIDSLVFRIMMAGGFQMAVDGSS